MAMGEKNKKIGLTEKIPSGTDIFYPSD